MGLGPLVCTDCNVCAVRDSQGDWHCHHCGAEEDSLKFLFCLSYTEAKTWDRITGDNLHTFYAEYKQEKGVT